MGIKRNRGFTLLEILTVVTIVGILAAIALPSYNSYIIRTNRSQAKQALQDIANREEQYRLDTRSYTSTLGSGGLGYTAPSDVLSYYSFTSPNGPSAIAAGASAADCNGTASQLQGPAYIINAHAIGSQSSDGDLCLDSNGNKTPTDKWAR